MTAAFDKSSGGTTRSSGGHSPAHRSPNGHQEKPPKILDIPIGIDATGMRQEFDSLGTVEVPADRYWGADPA